MNFTPRFAPGDNQLNARIASNSSNFPRDGVPRHRVSRGSFHLRLIRRRFCSDGRLSLERAPLVSVTERLRSPELNTRSRTLRDLTFRDLKFVQVQGSLARLIRRSIVGERRVQCRARSANEQAERIGWCRFLRSELPIPGRVVISTSNSAIPRDTGR